MLKISFAYLFILLLAVGCASRLIGSEQVSSEQVDEKAQPRITTPHTSPQLVAPKPTASAVAWPESSRPESTELVVASTEPTPSQAYLNLPIWARDDYEFNGGLYGGMLIRDFELTAHNNQLYRMSESERPITVFSFGYTFCPDVCPLTLYYLKEAVADFSLEEREHIQVLFITVDPARDSAEVLGKYMAAFDDDFIGLTGTEQEIQTVLDDYRAIAEKEIGTDAENYLVSHSSQIYLISPQQKLLLQYSFDFEGEIAQALQKDLTYLLSIIN